MKRVLASLLIAGCLLAGDTKAVAPKQPASYPFITRKGDMLFEGDKSFRFFGMCCSVLDMNKDQVLPDWSNRWPDEFEQRDIFDNLRRIGARATRVGIGLSIATPKDPGAQVHVQARRTYNEDAFKAMDRMLVLARQYDIRIILPIIASQSFATTRGVDEFAALTDPNKPKGAFWTDEDVKADYKHLVSFLLNRKNTINGVIYKDDPTILAWQYGNEFDSYAGDRKLDYKEYSPKIQAWSLEMAAYFKQLDPNHLVMEAGGCDRKVLVADPNVDIMSSHLYEYWAKVKNEPWELPPMARKEREELKGKKPLIIDELGLASYENLRGLLETIRTENIVGGLLWATRCHRRDGGWFYHNEGGTPVNSYHWPGFAAGYAYEEQRTLDLLRKEAYAIRGIPVPPIEKPTVVPELLRLEKGFTWRGSSGASHYTIQRAKTANGPWATVADSLVDSIISDVKTHEAKKNTAPTVLWYDEYVKTGETWHYRIRANNLAGNSAWSKSLSVTW